MSYEIYYDRAFIKVGEKYVPMVNEGSNNSFDINSQNREIPEKNWEVLNWKHRNQLLFTEEEIRCIARDYEQVSQESGICFISRNRSFEKGQFEHWILYGLKSAHTIEEYVSYGNGLEILDYSGNIKAWKHYSFSSTQEFLSLLDTLQNCKSLNVHFLDNRDVYRPKTKRKNSEKLSPKNLDEYYVLSAEYGVSKTRIYFSALTRSGIRYVYSPSSSLVRVFKHEGEATKYLTKYQRRFDQVVFEAKKIVKTAA